MRTVILGIICALAALGQGTNTIFVQVFNNTVTPGASTSVRNIGQQYHLLEVSVADVTAGSCASGWVGQIQLEASFMTTSGAGFFKIGVPIQGIADNMNLVTNASGAYTQVRVNYVSGNTGQCKLTAYYSGSITGTLTGSAPFSSYSDNFGYAINSTSATSPATIQACNRGSLVTYGLTLTNPTATVNTATIQLIDQTSSNTLAYVKFGLAAYSTMVLPNGTRPYIRSGGIFSDIPFADSTFLQITLSAATEVDWILTYRCE